MMRGLPVELRFGAGLVVAHPESIVRNALWSEDGGVFGSGYHLTGPAFLVGVGRPFAASARLSVVPELFVTTARTRVPIAGGEASLTHAAFHATLGLRWSF